MRDEHFAIQQLYMESFHFPAISFEDLQLLATWEVEVEEQHLKHIPFCFRMAFLSSIYLFLNVLHFLSACGLSCSGQFSFGSLLIVETSVL